MRKNRFVLNFCKRFRIYNACVDLEPRPLMGYVHFLNGFAYASNSYIAVKIPLAEIAGELPDYEHLDGKGIHFSAYKKILQHDMAKVVVDGIECISDEGNVLYKFPTQYDSSFAERIEKLFADAIKQEKCDDVSTICLDVSQLSKLSSAIGCESSQLVLESRVVNKVIIVTPNLRDGNAIGLIAPVMIS